MNRDKLWTEDIGQLFSSLDIVPTNDMSIETKMNTLTRLAVIMSIVMALSDPSLGLAIFFISLIIIITVYSANKEGYEDFPITSNRFCRDDVPLTFNDPDYVSPNQRLVGPPNPKTLVPPTIASPSHDLDAWKVNDMVNHSSVNVRSNFDLGRSGYAATNNSFLTPSKCEKCNYIPCMCHVTRKINRGNEESYKDLLLTQTIQPGVFQKSYACEPINSNIGITFNQQFPSTVVEETPTSIKFIEYDSPRGAERGAVHGVCGINDEFEQTQNNAYDPRFTGYGTSYRGYTDELTGQAKFFYKDVEAVTRPNFIIRSNVDVFPWADHYGPDKENNCNAENSRTLANNAFHESALKFRTEMQERLMRKRNAEMPQRRAFPKFTH